MTHQVFSHHDQQGGVTIANTITAEKSAKSAHRLELNVSQSTGPGRTNSLAMEVPTTALIAIAAQLLTVALEELGEERFRSFGQVYLYNHHDAASYRQVLRLLTENYSHD